jgi:hypothetical protein
VLDLGPIMAEKATQTYGTPNPIYVNVGGDTIASATVIGSLPYADSGNTCSFVNNYDAVCPFTGSTSADVVYRYNATSAVSIDVILCNSTYDTKVYVYENSTANLIACNDDDCGSDGFKSQLSCVNLTAGNSYYIVVDGYFGDCGNYELTVSECTPCIVSCPPGGVLEGEPDCENDTLDSYNGGCNSVPPAFTTIPCQGDGSTTMCGTYGGFTYFGLSYRDTDWYRVNLSSPSTVTWCVNGEYDTLIGIIDGNAGCPVFAFYDYTFSTPCSEGCLTANLPAGEWWFFAATSGFGPGAGACGGNYNGTLEWPCGPVSVESASFGAIKGLYR